LIRPVEDFGKVTDPPGEDKTKAGQFGPDQVLKLLQAVAILVAAAWTFWIYVAHDRDRRKLEDARLSLETKQLELNTLQTQSLQGTEQELRKTALEQQKLNLRQNELTASTEVNLKRVQLAQQELSLRQDSLGADTELQRQKLAVDLLSLEKGLKRGELDLAQQGRATYTTDLDVSCSSTLGQYDASLTFLIKNTSNGDVTVSWTLISTFIGTIIAENAESVQYVNSPPVPLVGFETPGSIEWASAGMPLAFIYANEEGERRENVASMLSRFEARHGGGGTKKLRFSDSVGATQNFIFRASSNDYFGITFSFGLDGATYGDGLFHERMYSSVPECPPSSSQVISRPTQDQESDPARR
jgi:hypothetical protein